MDMIPRDKAIAALSEINKLRHEWMGKAIKSEKTDPEYSMGLADCRAALSDSIERAYEILNEKD